jgi:murein DD-endopeptidase MepM/ murein hydrolase activator NlpD
MNLKFRFFHAIPVMVLAGCAPQMPAPVVLAPNQPVAPLFAQTSASPKKAAARLITPPGNAMPAMTPDIAVEALDAIPAAAMASQAQLAAIAPAAGPAKAGATSTVRHRVSPQDTLFKLARRYDTTTDAIVAANGLANLGAITPGQELVIPANTQVRGSILSEIQTVLNEPPPPLRTTTVPPVATGTHLNALEPAAGRAAPASSSLAVPTPADLPTQAHTVQPGETIYRIARQYDTSVIDLMAANNLAQPEALQAGSVIQVPGKPVAAAVAMADEPTSVSPQAETSLTPVAEAPLQPTSAIPIATAESVAPVAAEATEPEPIAEALTMPNKPKPTVDAATLQRERGRVDKAAARTGGHIWPVQGRVLRGFGTDDRGVSYTGINIAVPMNTPVLAMADGTVLYADNGLRSYGNMVLLRHAGGLVSAYAHNSHLLVKRGETVRKGQVLALAGASGNVSEPQLHFEVRRRATAVDPRSVLGEPRLAGSN